MKVFYIGIFGLLGVFSRYYLGNFVARVFEPPFPYGTFSVNILGSFLIGVIYVLGVERAAIPADMRIGILVGFLGGFTTFSSYCLDTARLIESAEYGYAVLYFVISPMLGLAASLGGLFLSRFLTRGAA